LCPTAEISIFSNSSHLEWRAGLSDTILKGTHPGTILARFGLILVEWSLDGPLPKLCLVIPTSNQDGRQTKNIKKGDEILIASWMEGVAVGHNFERDPPRDHPCQVWFNLVQRFQNYFILSQNVPKYELYKHNDELFNMYYRIFYEL
jgi:hypothetical protein